MGDPVNLSDPTGLFIQCSPPSVPSSDGSTCVFSISGGASPLPSGSGGGTGLTPQQQKGQGAGPAPCQAGTTRYFLNTPCMTPGEYQQAVKCQEADTAFLALSILSGVSWTGSGAVSLSVFESALAGLSHLAGPLNLIAGTLATAAAADYAYIDLSCNGVPKLPDISTQ